jgi:DNA invertase Pin-like site-specific DNA recombinase
LAVTRPRKRQASKRKSKTKTLVGIVRVSRVGKRGGESFISPELQIEGMHEWVERHPDFDLPEHLILRELDVSGARPLPERPGLSRALDLVESGEAAGIIGIRLDRIARSPEVWGELQRRVRRAGGVIVAADHGGVRGDLPEEELHDDMSQSFAKYEVARARRVFSLARRRAIERGVALTSPPAGYDAIESDDDPRGPKGKLVPNANARTISEAFRLRAGGASIGDVARYLDEQGVKSRAGRPRHSDVWSRSGVSNLLKSEVYVGRLRAGDLMNPHAHEPIVDEPTFLAAQKPNPNLNAGRESKHPFWLSKTTRCAGCGGALVGSHAKIRGKKWPIYRCTTRGCPEPASISAGRLEPWVEELMRARTPDLHEVDDQPVDGDDTELDAEREAAERELGAWRKLPVADLDPVFYAEGLRERRERLDAALEAIGRHEHDSRPRKRLSIELWHDWEALPVDERRAITRDVLTRVEVRKGKLSVPLDERIFVSFAE